MTTSLRRVAVTGMGAICGLGHALPEIWANIVNGKSGISLIQKIDTADLPVKIAGEVKNFTLSDKIMDPKEAARMDLFTHYALHSANEALIHAGLKDNFGGYRPEKVAAILGVGMGGFPFVEETHKTFLEKGHRRVSPFFIPSIIPNMASGLISITFGTKGTNYTIASACASSAHAISTAADEIRLGRHDVVITGGSESVISYLPFSGFSSMKALSKNNENPTKASRPFDKDRDGFVMGEGAGILILEDYEKAKARGAKIYAEIVGYGSSSDGHHITAPHPEGEGAIRCMKQAVSESKIRPEDIGHINTHGTSTPLGDIAETLAIKECFGAHAKKIHISSTKSMTGHLLGAAGGIESIFAIKALYEGIIPPTINIDNQDPQCDLDYTANQARKIQVEYALNNSFGFGGTNSSLVFKRV